MPTAAILLCLLDFVCQYKDCPLGGSVMTVAFELNGQSFTALNGGPHFKFNEAVSFQIDCATQEEVDYYWEKLSDGEIRTRSSAAG